MEMATNLRTLMMIADKYTDSQHATSATKIGDAAVGVMRRSLAPPANATRRTAAPGPAAVRERAHRSPSRRDVFSWTCHGCRGNTLLARRDCPKLIANAPVKLVNLVGRSTDVFHEAAEAIHCLDVVFR